MLFQGQYKQDKLLNYLFHGKTMGTFVDIGAHDGVTFSNSIFFEKHKNWSGVCVEPIPEVFEKLKQTRSCTCIQGCISSKQGVEKFLRIKADIVDTEMLSGLVADYDEKHISRIEKEIQEHKGSKEEIEVKCYDINVILQQEGQKRIDFFTIDTEGNEFKILQTIHFDQFDIDIVLVENNYKDVEMRLFMEEKGYTLIHRIGHDDIYRKKENTSFYQSCICALFPRFLKRI
jgi:FkbM family methyltransferase